MNPTHETDHNAAQPRAFDENFLADLPTDMDYRHVRIASATGMVAKSPVLGLPMTDADRRRYALCEAGYTGWVDRDGYARTEAEVDSWSALMRAFQTGYLPGVGGGWLLTAAGRDAWQRLDTASQYAMAEAVAQGVALDQLADEDWDGEPFFEWLSDRDADEAESYGERLTERYLDQAEAADAAADSDIVSGRDTTPSTCPVDLVTETDDDTTARVLRSAALYLERHGWIQGSYYDATAGVFTPAACMVGAIGMVCYGGPVDAPAQHFDDPGFLDFEAAVLHLDRYLLVEDSSESYEFNDAKGRRVEDVTRVLRDAASRPADELIDALRVIERHNADLAALSATLIPGGTFAGGGTDGGGVQSGCDCAEGVSGLRWPCADCPGWQSQPGTSGDGDVR